MIRMMVAVVSIFAAPTANSQDYLPLFEYIQSVNNTEVSFEGQARYDKSEDEFTYYDSDGRPYHMTMDAGRKAREQVQRDCENSGFLVSRSELCNFAANGTIEIVGGRLQLSVDEVLKAGR